MEPIVPRKLLAGRTARKPSRIREAALGPLPPQDGAWWIGWVEEIPGVNCQGKTRAELQKNLRSALKEALEFNCDDALAAAQEGYQEEAILL
jgi:predicted RNase H-like HicB family nuclease